MLDSVTLGDVLSAISALVGALWAASRIVARTERALAVSDALNAERHATTTGAIEGLAKQVKEQNGRVGKLERWQSGVEAVERANGGSGR
jgi:hypothetical protein